MSRLFLKVLMWVIGIASLVAVAVFLALYESSPGRLSSPHARAIPGSTILSCKQCHAEEGLTTGCLNCHTEIQQQFDRDSGYHAYLLTNANVSCQQCHPEHLGHDFELVSALSWQDEVRTNFSHPHVEFSLNGSHDKLSCEACHQDKLTDRFALEKFPDQKRAATSLGLSQSCNSCHEDIHKSGKRTSTCTDCHSQDAFKPAVHFNHDQFFKLEGVHAQAACSACHAIEEPGVGGAFGAVKGSSCMDCHASPHQSPQISRDCQSCHNASDVHWLEGGRGIDPALHARFGFALVGVHAELACKGCHAPEQPYAERYPIPARRPDQCGACHTDPHDAQFADRKGGCLDCHAEERFTPSTLGPDRHPETYPLEGAHQAVACSQCHKKDSASGVRRFVSTPTACRDCHADPHRGEFKQEIRQNDCTGCHLNDFSTFRIERYTHKRDAVFFRDQGHAKAACRACHSTSDEAFYRDTPTDCAACHADIHRGQLARNGTTACSRCHGSTADWSADGFIHNRDSNFVLDGSHRNVDCFKCHQPVRQKDNTTVVQYRPLTTRCEDCHGLRP